MIADDPKRWCGRALRPERGKFPNGYAFAALPKSLRQAY